MASQAKNTFEIPKWFVENCLNNYLLIDFCSRAGKPIAGLHLDVVKDGKLIQVRRDYRQKFHSFII